jgi:hypothetical protein
MGLNENELKARAEFNENLRVRTRQYLKDNKESNKTKPRDERVTPYRICKDIDINLSTLPRFLNGSPKKEGDKDMALNGWSTKKLDNYLELKGY